MGLCCEFETWKHSRVIEDKRPNHFGGSMEGILEIYTMFLFRMGEFMTKWSNESANQMGIEALPTTCTDQCGPLIRDTSWDFSDLFRKSFPGQDTDKSGAGILRRLRNQLHLAQSSNTSPVRRETEQENARREALKKTGVMPWQSGHPGEVLVGRSVSDRRPKRILSIQKNQRKSTGRKIMTWQSKIHHVFGGKPGIFGARNPASPAVGLETLSWNTADKNPLAVMGVSSSSWGYQKMDGFCSGKSQSLGWEMVVTPMT